MRIRFFIICSSVGMLLSGCGSSMQDPTIEPDPDVAVDAASGFGQESWGIGTSWYDYDSKTHAVTPRPVVYTVGDRAFEVTNYYDERGTSGYFTIRSAGESLQLATNVKDEPACASLEPLGEVECDTDADLVFTTLKRPLPEAGFAVSNPGIWPIPRPGMRVWSGSETTTNKNRESSSDKNRESSSGDVEDDSRTEIHTVAIDPEVSRIADHRGVHIQIDPEFRLTAWTVSRTDTGWRFDVLCGEADHTVQRPLQDARSTTLELAEQEPRVLAEQEPGVLDQEPGVLAEQEPGVLVSLCDSRLENAQSWLGLWPIGSYDFIATVVEGRLTMKLHPAALHWNWGVSTGSTAVDEARDALVWEGLQ